MIDLRSDTVTKPTKEMLKFMTSAEVGDDVMDEDPTVNSLQEKMATLLGKEKALFLPSGSMANQVAIGAQTSPGDELICHKSYHVNKWEAGGPARLWGVSTNTSDAEDYFLTADYIKNTIKPDDDPHYVQTKLVCLENTLNRGGGRVFPETKMREVSDLARSKNLNIHLDGARLWNASIASGIDLKKWASYVDTVSLCFSKGMGAPIGSVLVGPEEVIEKAYKLRKLLGGGMRQVGVMASACLYALDHHFERLKQDHVNAKLLGEAFCSLNGVDLEFDQVESNLVWLKVEGRDKRALEICQWFWEKGVQFYDVGDSIRLVTHLGISEEDVQQVGKLVKICPK